jgi:hypothetical protein
LICEEKIKAMSNELTDQKLEEILARCKATTRGPWKSYIEGRDHECGSDFIMTGTEYQRGNDIELVGGLKQFDQDFIASAKQDIPLLIDEIRRLKILLARVK